MGLFIKIVGSLNSITILTKSSILGYITGCWVCFGYFFKFIFSIDLLFPLTLLEINWTSTLHVNVCPRLLETIIQLYYNSYNSYTRNNCIASGTCQNLTTKIPQQCLSYLLKILANFGEVFELFLGAFVVDFEYSFFLVNIIKGFTLWHILVEHQIGAIFMEVVVKY